MQQLPQETYNQIAVAMCRPVGTFGFWYASQHLFDKNVPGGIIINIISEGHYFRLDRDQQLHLNYFHSSPGTGTRHAFIDLNDIPPSNIVFICLDWSTSNINLYLRSNEIGDEEIHAVGVPSSKQLSIGKDGNVYQVGDIGVKTMRATIYSNGEEVLKSSAIQTWHESIEAISILETGISSKGYIYEVVVTNLSLSMLVTGFETYTKTRFLEIEQEGITPSTDSLLNNFLSKREREKGLLDILKKEAEEKNNSLLEYIVSKDRINFQDFQQCKIAFNKAYGIKFGEIVVDQTILERIQQYIRLRHKIIHVSPITAFFPNEKTSKNEPIFPNRELANQAKKDFSEFIEQLHKATLSLLPSE